MSMAIHVKTPVTILQELVVKRGWPPPEYNIVHQRVGCVQTEFTYELEMQGIIATATGKSKMTAKHETARNMLQLLGEDGLYIPSPEVNRMLSLSPAHAYSSTNNAMDEDGTKEQIVDYVGKLSDACAAYYMEQPQYELISTMGPPHAREFTVRCTLMLKKVVIMASKKKTAKQQAAEKMWSLYKSVFESVQDLPVRPHLGVTAMNYETGFLVHAYEKDISLGQLVEMFAPPFTEEHLKTSLSELDLTYELEKWFDGESEKIYTCNANACVDLCSYGKGSTDEEAKTKAVEHFFKCVRIYLHAND